MNNIRYFITKTLLFLTPVLILLLVYVCMDPFKVIWHYDNYYPEGDNAVVINIDNVSIENFNNLNKTRKFDSFIIGNSRSMFWEVDEWMKYLPQNSSCYHIQAYGESLAELTEKLEYIGENAESINNVLFVLDWELLGNANRQTEFITAQAPRAVNFSNFISFQGYNLKAFLSPDFLYAYLDYKISGKIKTYMMDKHLITPNTSTYNNLTNEVRYDMQEEKIREGTYYDERIMSMIHSKKQLSGLRGDDVFTEKHISYLNKIKSVMDKFNTSYKIVISPLLDQKRLSETDSNTLEHIFGSQNIKDFSGVNWVTEDFHNFYEDSHYRPHVTRKLLQEIYK